jgi:hypothetical protein
MVIHHFNIMRGAIAPDKAKPPLIIDPDAMLPSAITFQRFKPIVRRYAKILQAYRSIQHAQLASRDGQNIRRKALRDLSQKHQRCALASEAFDHKGVLYRITGVMSSITIPQDGMRLVRQGDSKEESNHGQYKQ